MDGSIANSFFYLESRLVCDSKGMFVIKVTGNCCIDEMAKATRAYKEPKQNNNNFMGKHLPTLYWTANRQKSLSIMRSLSVLLQC